MNITLTQTVVDPIQVEVTRTRLEAIGQEAAAAVEQTAISPIVTDNKDYSVTICDSRGAMLLGVGLIELHFGAAMRAVRSTIKRHGDTIKPGDVFIANDPHNDGGLHPQDVVIQRPVFVGDRVVAWVALCAHMMDMGGMVPGSSAVAATECYQEALRLPSVRLVREGEEATEIWNIICNNIRSAKTVEMDMRSLVIGANVAERKLAKLVEELGADTFDSIVEMLISSTERVLRERVSRIEDGRYRIIAWVEYGASLYRIPVTLVVKEDKLIYDLSEAPPQVPHFINSKPYIVKAAITSRMRRLLALDLPVNQAIFNVVELITEPGSIMDCVMPAPIAAAHMDATLPVATAAVQCLQNAIHASPRAWGREYYTAQPMAAYGTGRWSYLSPDRQRQVFTLLDGSLGGSPAGHDRDGIDFNASLTPWGFGLECADIEILELAYPILFRERRVRSGAHGYGRFRSGSGCQESFSAHGSDSLVGNMTGTRSWFASAGTAGGMPGATTAYYVYRADGSVEHLPITATGVQLADGDRFETCCASGGGFGDPLDREVDRIIADMEERRLEREEAEAVYGIVFAGDGTIDTAASEKKRADLRRVRLKQAAPAAVTRPAPNSLPEGESLPLYPGIIQRGRYAVSEKSGAVLAEAPGNWLDGCPVLQTSFTNGDVCVVSRSYLDPMTGTILYASIDREGEGVPLEILPARWATVTQARSSTCDHGKNVP